MSLVQALQELPLSLRLNVAAELIQVKTPKGTYQLLCVATQELEGRHPSVGCLKKKGMSVS